MIVSRTERPSGAVALPVVGARMRGESGHRDRVAGRAAVRGGAIPVRDGDAGAVRVEQHLGGVEAEPAPGCRRPADPVAVELAGCDAANQGMPVRPGPVGRGRQREHVARRQVLGRVEQQEVDGRRPLRVDAEVDAAGRPGGPERVRPARAEDADRGRGRRGGVGMHAIRLGGGR